MIYFGMDPNPSLSAKMTLTKLELSRMGAEALRKNCYQSGNGRFNCLYAHKGNKIRIGVFDTVAECNSAWDKADKKYALIKKLELKGYQRKKYKSGTVKYSAKLADGWKQFDTPEAARAAYEDMINKQLKELEND